MTGPDPLEHPRALAELVALQPGAVVSRTVMKGPSGTVTLFAFGAGEGLSEHATPHEALAVCLEGEVEISLAGDAHLLAAGQGLRLPPAVPHAVRAVTDVRLLLVMLRSREA